MIKWIKRKIAEYKREKAYQKKIKELRKEEVEDTKEQSPVDN